jgi:hypothetical protein
MHRGLLAAILIAFAAAGIVVVVIRDLSIPRALPRGRKQMVNFLFGCIWIAGMIVLVCIIAIKSPPPDSPVVTLISDFFGQ